MNNQLQYPSATQNVAQNPQNGQQKQQQNELCVKYYIGDNEIKLTPSIVQNYIVGNAEAKITPVEFKFFTELCKVRKLNPFLNEAYLIKYGSQPAQLVVGKDAIIKRAVLNEKYDGMESGIIAYNENTGEEIERQGTYVPKGYELTGGWAKVYVKNRKYPSYVSVNLSEVAQTKKDGTLNSNWASKPATMVEKVAKVRALREAFVDDLGGMYDADELEKNDLPKESGNDKIIIEQKEELPLEENEEININEL